jgi:hypothetical protein
MDPGSPVFTDTEAAILAQSFDAAVAAGKPRADAPTRRNNWFNFEDATAPVLPSEKFFHVKGGVFLGTEYGAVDPVTFKSLGIGAVVNLACTKSNVVPNAFAADGVAYLCFPLSDLPGANVRSIFKPAVEFIEEHRSSGTRVLVHCSAGLSRSASIVVAWLMNSEVRLRPASAEASGAIDSRHILHDAVTLLACARGRRLQINPGFWLELAAEERRLMGWKRGTPPSLDFSGWWIEDFGRMGVPDEKILAALIVGDYVDWDAASGALFD